MQPPDIERISLTQWKEAGHPVLTRKAGSLGWYSLSMGGRGNNTPLFQWGPERGALSGQTAIDMAIQKGLIISDKMASGFTLQEEKKIKQFVEEGGYDENNEIDMRYVITSLIEIGSIKSHEVFEDEDLGEKNYRKIETKIVVPRRRR